MKTAITRTGQLPHAARRRCVVSAEPLERRAHLSATSTTQATVMFSPPAPDLFVRGSLWTDSFMASLQAKGVGQSGLGYSIYSASELRPPPNGVLPWICVNQIVLKYAYSPTGSSVPSEGAIVVRGHSGPYTVRSVVRDPDDPSLFVATLDRPLGGGNPSVGNGPLPSENGDRVNVSVYGVSTNGTLVANLNVLQGDVDGSGVVLASDYASTKKRFFTSTRDTTTSDNSYTPFCDVDGSGNNHANDFAEVKKRFFQSLPPASAAPASAMPPGARRIRPAATSLLG
jgi:hypothetical protein